MADSQVKNNNRIFEKTTMGYLDELFGTALRLTRNERDAEDLVQDTYLKAQVSRFQVGKFLGDYAFEHRRVGRRALDRRYPQVENRADQ